LIPRTRLPEPTPVSNVPPDAPKLEHLAVDFTWLLSTGQTVSHTSMDGDAPVETTDTHYIVRDTNGRREIRRDAVLMFDVMERRFTTDPPEWTPRA
jgi:hypothetical protein